MEFSCKQVSRIKILELNCKNFSDSSTWNSYEKLMAGADSIQPLRNCPKKEFYKTADV